MKPAWVQGETVSNKKLSEVKPLTRLTWWPTPQNSGSRLAWATEGDSVLKQNKTEQQQQQKCKEI